ncbi:hypothetical protein [Peijinzhouia sedimentorum]
MKKQLIIPILMALLSFPAMAQQTQTPAAQDSIVVKFGDNSRVVFLVKDAKDYEILRTMDLNKIAREISDANRESIRNVAYVTVGGNGKTKNIEVEVNELPGESYTARVKLGNWEIITDDRIEDLDEIESIRSEKKVEVRVDETVKTKRSFNIDLGINNFIEGETTQVNFSQIESQLPPQSIILGDQYDVKPWGSWYVALGYNNQTKVVGPFTINYGGSFSFYNFKFGNTATVVEKLNDQTVFYERPNADGIKSKLAISHVNLHFVPMFDFGFGRKTVIQRENGPVTINRYRDYGFRIGAGVYAGHRLGTHAKYRYRTDGNAQRDKDKDNFFLEDWRYGIRGQIGWRNLDVFVNYDMNHMFKKDRGPELNAISFGLIL